MTNKNQNMKIQTKVLVSVAVSIAIFSSPVTKSLENSNPFLKGIISSIKNKDFIEVSGQYGGQYNGSPFVTIEVPALTTNKKPPITGTCQIGETLNFTIKYGPTYNIVSETINNFTCVSSPYSINPTITIPDGKYRVDVDVASGGGQLNN